MTNIEVIKRFLQFEEGKTNIRTIQNGHYIYSGRTLHTERLSNTSKLINYDTVIAFITDGLLFINTDKYSTTTSKIQHQIHTLAEQQNLIYKDVSSKQILEIIKKGGE